MDEHESRCNGWTDQWGANKRRISKAAPASNQCSSMHCKANYLFISIRIVVCRCLCVADVLRWATDHSALGRPLNTQQRRMRFCGPMWPNRLLYSHCLHIGILLPLALASILHSVRASIRCLEVQRANSALKPSCLLLLSRVLWYTDTVPVDHTGGSGAPLWQALCC